MDERRLRQQLEGDGYSTEEIEDAIDRMIEATTPDPIDETERPEHRDSK